jgi:hypothetical protein
VRALKEAGRHPSPGGKARTRPEDRSGR